MATVLTIDGTNWAGKIRKDSLTFTSAEGNKYDCSFTLIVTGQDPALAARPQEGQELIITVDGVRIFGGYLLGVDEEGIASQGSWNLQFTCQGIDYSSLAARSIITQIWEAQTPAQILADMLVISSLADDGVTIGTVDAWGTITRAIANYQTPAQMLDKIAEITSYTWWIDEFKVLHLRDRISVAAPFSINAVGANLRRIRVKRASTQLRTEQIIRAGYDLTALQSENWKGDGTNKTFVTAFPIAKVPTITLGGTPQTVGIQGLDEGKEWYWNSGTAAITRDPALAAPTAGQAVAISYYGTYPLIVSKRDEAAIADRAAKDNTSGVITNLLDETTIDREAMAEERADGLLLRFSTVPTIVTFETDDNIEAAALALRAGQLITITMPTHQLSGQYLIENVAFTIPNDVHPRRATVTCSSSRTQGSWTDYFRRLYEISRAQDSRDSELVIPIRTFTDTVNVDDTFTATELTDTYVDAVVAAPGAIVGFSEVAG